MHASASNTYFGWYVSLNFCSDGSRGIGAVGAKVEEGLTRWEPLCLQTCRSLEDDIFTNSNFLTHQQRYKNGNR